MLAAVAPATAQPSARIALPEPTGRCGVGTMAWQWIDSTRTDTIGQAHLGRHITAQVWYPSERGNNEVRAFYAPLVDTTASDYGRLMARVETHATMRAPFAASLTTAPVVVLSTGRVMAAYDYSSIAEELASHGVIVVGVNSSLLSRMFLTDGNVIPPLPAPPLSVLQHFDSADVYFEPMVQAVTGDLAFVLKRLSEIDQSDAVLRRRLDLNRLGMMGHSNGAIAASRACASERRCQGFLGIEGTQTRELRKNGVTKPYALLISDQSLGFDAENVYRELGNRSGTHYTVLTVRGAGHNTFTDLLLIRPTLFSYHIEPRRGVDITRGAVHAFFQAVLQDRSLLPTWTAPLASYSEVSVQTTFGREGPRE